MRYSNPRRLISIGILDDSNSSQEDTFELVSQRIETAFFVANARSVVLQRNWDKDLILKECEKALLKMELIK